MGAARNESPISECFRFFYLCITVSTNLCLIVKSDFIITYQALLSCKAYILVSLESGTRLGKRLLLALLLAASSKEREKENEEDLVLLVFDN